MKDMFSRNLNAVYTILVICSMVFTYFVTVEKSKFQIDILQGKYDKQEIEMEKIKEKIEDFSTFQIQLNNLRDQSAEIKQDLKDIKQFLMKK